MFAKYIDLHMHGGYGIDIMKADTAEIERLSMLLGQNGVCAWTPTLVGDSLNILEERVGTVSKARANGADIIGIHIEGPFISPEKSGVLPKENIVPCDTDYFDVLSKYGLPLRFTIAPESKNAIPFIEYVTKKGGIVTLGHSSDDGTMTKKAITAGASGFTHLFNAMRGIHHRDGSITKTALLSGLPCEIIADGFHLSPETIRLVHKTIGTENIVLVTDAMSAMQSCPGEYDFCNKKVYFDGRTVSTNGILAGSCLTSKTALENFCLFTGSDIETTAKQMIKNSLNMIGRADLITKYLQ